MPSKATLKVEATTKFIEIEQAQHSSKEDLTDHLARLPAADIFQDTVLSKRSSLNFLSSGHTVSWNKFSNRTICLGVV